MVFLRRRHLLGSGEGDFAEIARTPAHSVLTEMSTAVPAGDDTNETRSAVRPAAVQQMHRNVVTER